MSINTVKGQKTHWKTLFNPKYIGSYSFQPEEVKTLTIKKIMVEEVKSKIGTDVLPIIYWEETSENPLVGNHTNSQSISKIAKSSFLEDWVGVKVSLFVTNIRVQGQDVEAIRIRHPKTGGTPSTSSTTCPLKKEVKKWFNLTEKANPLQLSKQGEWLLRAFKSGRVVTSDTLAKEGLSMSKEVAERINRANKAAGEGKELETIKKILL